MTKNWWDDRWRLNRLEVWALVVFISALLWIAILYILRAAGVL